MTVTKLLVANRGEIAVRVIHTAAELGIHTVAVGTADDADSAHLARADHAERLPGSGVAGYTDVARLLDIAARRGCDAVHPGYGFLSESAEFAARCRDAGVTFVAPRTELLELFADKTRARQRASQLCIPVLAGTEGATTVDDAAALLDSLGPGGAVMIKALHGGGGRGMRPVFDSSELAEAFERCQSESKQAGGDGTVYAERLLPEALHIEVQIVGDGTGAVCHLWERDCSVQRRRQKLVEIAPSPQLPTAARRTALESALELTSSVRYDGLGTVEFLVDSVRGEVVFLEVNPRLQVEHPVTEEITGVDLVATQLRLATGATLADLGLEQPPEPRGMAVETRVNTESMHTDGTVHPANGAVTRFQPPSGRGIRVDTHRHLGYHANPRYDSLLAKVITHGRDPKLPAAAARAERALRAFELGGTDSNIPLLRAIMRHPEFLAGRAHTRFVDTHLADLIEQSAISAPPEGRDQEPPDAPDGATAITAPVSGVVVEAPATSGQRLRASDTLLVLEAMKMEHVVTPETQGDVRQLLVAAGDSVTAGAVLAVLEPVEVDAADAGDGAESVSPEYIRPDLTETIERHRVGLDEARPEAVARRHKGGRRTARENIADLCDPGSFVEYGALTLAAQRRRRSLDDLITRTPADGLICGIGSVNGQRCVVMSYDYTVLAGTQGLQNHRKTDRMLTLAVRERLPVLLFAEGGGGRPGDTDTAAVASLDVPSFRLFAELSGTVPLVSIVSGRCFAGNAALAGCSDVIIATRDANLGMGGPAMIEGGGLGAADVDEIGPMSVQQPNGVVDVLAEDDADAVHLARRYLSYFQETARAWTSADQRLLRHVVPENRVRTYDVHQVVRLLADEDSRLELRPRFGVGIITALARIEGRAVGMIANNPRHLGGAIDADAADKAARFLQLCDTFGLPVVSLCDTPGFMVGPDAERTATVRHFSRMFVAGANLTVPIYTVVLRKGYGLGAMAMAGGELKAPVATLAWPTGELGGMGLEGAVRLGYRAELDEIANPDARQERYRELVADMYERGKALSTASVFEVDDVIDPACTRDVLVRLLTTRHREHGAGRSFVDTW